MKSLPAVVVTCTEAMTISEVMKRMTAERFRYLPVVELGRLVGIVSIVVELGRLVGIVSIGDVVKYRLTAMQHESQSVHDYILTA